MGLFVVVKGLLFVYFKDLQEDKVLIFQVVDDLELVLVVMVGMVVDFSFNFEVFEEVAGEVYFDVIDLVDWVVCELGCFFCDVYYIVGLIVCMVEDKGIFFVVLLLQDM